jgi:hypothetical protein
VIRCEGCGCREPGKSGFDNPTFSFRQPGQVTYHRHRRDCHLHPLRAVFMAAGYSREQGMNWLQDHGLIADECIDFWQVAPCDLDEVLEQAAFRFNPAWIAALRKDFQEKMHLWG